MIQVKKKPCDGESCNGSLQYIWKNQGRSRFCKNCWLKLSSVEVILNPVKSTGTSPEKRKHIARVSNRMQKLMNGYRRLRILFFQESKNCRCQARLHELYPDSGVRCMEEATDVHHRRGRGIYLLDISTWIPVCRACHAWIEENPNKSKELGLSESRLNTIEHEKDSLVISLKDLTLPEVLDNALVPPDNYHEFGEAIDGAA
jgi:hypothetical protein